MKYVFPRAFLRFDPPQHRSILHAYIETDRLYTTLFGEKRTKRMLRYVAISLHVFLSRTWCIISSLSCLEWSLPSPPPPSACSAASLLPLPTGTTKIKTIRRERKLPE